ncbi:DNA topoisomerase I [archaeon]|jgi:DNA topoisomerase I|nr:DNA topoisomerase I [archaeon]
MPTKRKTRAETAVDKYSSSMKNVKNTTEKEVKEEVSREEILRSTTEKVVKDTLDDSKKTVVKSVSRPSVADLMTVEKEGVGAKKVIRKKGIRKKAIKKKAVRKAKKTITKDEIYVVPKILLKKNGFELIITEKPQAALKIASALGESTKRELVKGVPYYEVDRDGKKLIVACAVGHLFTLKQNVPGSGVPIFDVSWVPNYLARKGDFTKKYYDTLLRLAKNAGSVTVATDYDIEGEVIGTNVVRLICNQKDAQRMKFSTLTQKELDTAYENKQSHINWGQAIAGESRHYLDWFYGINLSRALMNAVKSTGRFKIMSIGRVQGPSLKLIVDREREIQKFEPVPFWQVFITVEKPKVELKYTKDIFEKGKLSRFDGLVGKKVMAETKKSEQIVPPNPPFNLTTLQTEAYKLYGITPTNSLRAAQSLYLAGLISYPRTSSQKLPDAIDYKSILDILKKRYKVTKLIKKSKPLEGAKTDPAHPSIYPTGNNQILSGYEEKVYDLIVKRFLALFCEDAIIDKKRVSVKVDDLTFSTNGSQIRKKAWMEFYPVKTKEVDLKDVEGEVEIMNKQIEEKETQPPKRYSPASILSELEKRNLGTKATRAAILETLYDRGYIKDTSVKATPLGMSLIETLEKYSPIIIDEALTREIQDKMDDIVEKKVTSSESLMNKEEEILNKAKESIVSIAKGFEEKEKLIGEELMGAQDKQREIEREENTLNDCPKCGKGKLRITYSPKTKRHFIGCSAYPECKNTYSLPPNGVIKQAGKNCEKCSFPLMMSLRKGKKPWMFCFNYECETNKERVEAYKQKMAEQN